MVRSCSPVSRFQTLITMSAPQLDSTFPLDCQLTPSTWWVWPSNDLIHLPSATECSLTNLSAEQLASTASSGENSRPNTVSLCASLRNRTSLPVATSHSLISPLRDGSPPPLATSLPSWLKAR